MNILKISDLRLWVHLGCSDQEKHHVQCVAFDVMFSFKEAPKAIKTDDLNHSVCYAKVSELIKDFLNEKRHNLIESLTFNVHKEVYKYLDDSGFNDIKLEVKVKKLSPPVPDIHGYVSYTYSN